MEYLDKLSVPEILEINNDIIPKIDKREKDEIERAKRGR